MLKTQIAALTLRSFSAISKLIFVTALGYLGEEKILGQFAIFATIVIFYTQIAGLEIHQTIARKIYTLDSKEKQTLFAAQSYAVIVSYIILLTLIIFYYFGLLGNYWVLGAFILIGEHITTELYRYNTIMLRPMKASAILFIKNFGWVGAFLSLYAFSLIQISIVNILSIWLIFVVIAMLISVKGLKHVVVWGEFYFKLRFIKKTFSLVWESKSFMFSAASIAVIVAADKIILSNYYSLEEVGNYYFYQTLAGVPALVVGMTLGTTMWPKCIKLASLHLDQDYTKQWKKMNRYYMMSLAIISLVLIILVPYCMSILGHSIEKSDINLLAILLIASSFFVLCEPYKLKLYIEKSDVALVFGNLWQLILVLSFLFISILFKSLLIFAFALLLANFISLIFYLFQVPSKTQLVLSRKGAHASR